jgi:hypothetical protein
VIQDVTIVPRTCRIAEWSEGKFIPGRNYVIKQYDMKACVGLFLTSAWMEVNRQFHALDAVPPGRAPGTHLLRGWLGPRVGLAAVEKRKIVALSRESNPDNH